MKYYILTKYWESYSRITKGISITSLIIIFCAMADIGKIVGISDFIVTLMGRVAKTASCITFIMYVTIKLILSTFINIKEKDNFTLWISLIAFLITMLLQV